MLDNIEVEDAVKDLIVDLVMVLYAHGITQVHMGGLMRMVGVADESAAEHDDEIMVVTQEFAKYIQEQHTVQRTTETLH